MAAAGVGVLAAAVCAVGTAAPGPGLDPDAQSYIGAGITFARGGYFRVPTSSWMVADSTEPLTHFPPGVPILVSGPIELGLSPLQAGRLVVVVAAGVTWAILVALIARPPASGLQSASHWRRSRRPPL